MGKDVENYVKFCEIYAKNKVNRRKYGHLTATNIDLDISAFEIVALDICGPFLEPIDDEGISYKHILTIIDIASR